MGSKSRFTANEVIRDLYAEWLNYPNSDARVARGLPRTRGCFAIKHGINRATLWRWEKDFEFQRERLQSIQNLVSPDDWKTIMLAQKQNAINGNLNAAKWLAEQLQISPQSAFDNPDPEKEDEQELAGMSEEELEAYLEEQDDE